MLKANFVKIHQQNYFSLKVILYNISTDFVWLKEILQNTYQKLILLMLFHINLGIFLLKSDFVKCIIKIDFVEKSFHQIHKNII